MMKNLIATADDFGVYPAINDAVIEAINAKKINSTSVLSNYDGSDKYPSSLQNLETLLNATNGRGDIGCHVTLTSGKPITGDKMNFICNKKGYFRTYNDFVNFNNQTQLRAMEDELHAQIDRMHEIAGFKVKHLTNHHNSLTLFPHHFEVYLKVARDYNIPIRSTHIVPEMKQNIYIYYLQFKLRKNVLKSGLEEIKLFSKEINDYFIQHSNGVKSPNDLDSSLYGPAPFMPAVLNKKLLDTKQNKLDKYFKKFNTDSRQNSELLLHLYKKTTPKIDLYPDLDYPGVDAGYFKRRVIEFESIMRYDQSKWTNIEQLGWDFL